MIYEFILESKTSLPIFRNEIRIEKQTVGLDICFDTGNNITTFYMSETFVRKLYPDMYDAKEEVELKTADGKSTKVKLHIIPDFILKDTNNQLLHIKNLYCRIDDANKLQMIDVLLAGDVFYNSSATVTPRRIDKKYYRALQVNTLHTDKDTLVMQKIDNEEGTFYICGLHIFV